jgi:hypothetical protein
VERRPDVEGQPDRLDRERRFDLGHTVRGLFDGEPITATNANVTRR